MTHDQLATSLLAAHGAVLLGVLAAYYKFGDRSDHLTKSLQGVDALLSKMRRRLASDLGSHLAPLIRTAQSGAVVSSIVGPRGETYREEPAALAESEAFKESVQKFVESGAAVVVDYSSTVEAREKWCFWARALSWCLLANLLWFVLVTGFVFAMERCIDVPLASWQLKAIGGISGLAIACGLATLPPQLVAHDKLINFRIQYDSP